MTPRGRERAGPALAALAALLLAAAALTGYAARALLDADRFSDRAAVALQDDRVRTVLAERITDDLVLANEPDLVAARPLIASAVGGAIGGDAFAGLFRRGVRDLHRAVIAGDEDTLTLTLVDAATVAAAALRELRPGLADDLARADPGGDARLAVGGDVAAAASDLAALLGRVRWIALLLAALAVAAAAASVAVVADRRRAVTRLGLAVVAAGVLVWVLAGALPAAAIDRIDDPAVRAAAPAVAEAFLADLRAGALLLAGIGAVVAAAAASIVRPRPVADRIRAALRLAGEEPARPARRALRGAALVAAGVLAIAAPETALRLVITLAGLLAVFAGVEALLRLTYRPREPRAAQAPPAAGRRRWLVPAAGAALLVVAGSAAFAATGGVDAPAAAPAACNGHRALCERRLDAVALPATHNSMSAPLPGWFSTLQERPIAGQLADGIRGLLLDTHYADALPNGRHRTYFGSPEELQRAIAQDGVSAESVAAALRLRDRLGFRGEGERGLYLCHAFCELGATPLDAVLGDLRDFLATNPGEVVVVVNQDAITPADFVEAVRAADLGPYAATLSTAAPLPTLGEMVASGRRLVLLAENEAGEAPWYQLAYERLVQETPFTFAGPPALTEPDGLPASCRANRGPEGAPLFLLNHWINTDPAPRPSNAALVNAYEALLGRARACARLRGRTPNLLAVDFYRRGDVFRVADTLNGVG
jgi:hypothetical protein